MAATAYAALVSLIKDLELIPNHLTHSFSFENKQITSLSQTVDFLIDFMESYDSRGCAAEAVEVLESRIASAAHAAHDVIESHIVDQIRAGSTRGGKVRPYFLLDLQRAIDKMEFVKRKAMQFKAKRGSKEEQPMYSPSSSAIPSGSLKNIGMVGFDEVVLQLVEILAGSSNRRLAVPIAGMGGLGKTSLAKTVYEHSYVKYHFEVCLWATISQQYSAENILTELLYGKSKSTTGRNASELGEELYQRLYGKRYLIVLDDMWDVEAWDEVQLFLPDNGNGSRVVVTTRLRDLAAHLSPSPFELNFLDEDRSWELFCGKTFGEEGCPVELEEIGRKIVKRCRGLPLSIVVTGGHLRKSSMAIEYWEKFGNYMNPILSIGEEEQCLEILSLSYHHLPIYLKPCFLYLGIFKEDIRIEASKLVQCWIGEGFLKPKKGLSLEEIAQDCLKDLTDRSLIIDVTTSWNGKVDYCKIHDTVRELCLKVCKNEKFMCVAEDYTQVIGRTERHIVIPKGEKFNSGIIGAKQSAPLLRTVAFGGDTSFLNELLLDNSLLRVLACTEIFGPAEDDVYLPEKINLRTVALSPYWLSFSTPAYSIPSSLSTWNLQTLCLPTAISYEIWEMPYLRHIQVFPSYLPDPVLDEGSTQQKCIVLQNLHTLDGVLNLKLTEEVCKRMPNLKILVVWYDKFCDDYCLHNLDRFDKLKTLNIRFGDDPKWSDAVLSLPFPTSLEELSLWNCHLGWEDLTMIISSVPHLGSLRVELVRGSEWNLDEEEFCCLKKLMIDSCPELIHLNANSSHFPALKTLSLSSTPKLSEIPFDIGEIPTLERINLIDCSTSAAVSAVRMVMEQEANGNHDLQLYVHFATGAQDELERFQQVLQQECLTTNSLRIFLGSHEIRPST